MTGMLVLVVGPSGAGKDTLIDGVRQHFADDPRLHFVTRDITRPSDAGGEAHNPVSIEDFDRLEREGAYGLSWGAHDLRYGLPWTELRGLETGQIAIANGSRSVLDEARERFDRLAIISITAPEDVLRSRLQSRGRESADSIDRRVNRAAAYAVSGSDVHTVINDGSVAHGVERFRAVLSTLLDRTPA